MIPTQEHTAAAPIKETLVACQILFSTKVYLAKTLVEKLEPTDLAVAYREVMVNYTLCKCAFEPAHNRYHRRDLARLSRVYTMLNDYIAARSVSAPALRVDNLCTPDQRNRTGHFFAGAVPSRVFRLGEFLYYRGVISREMLDSAISWQRNSRPLLGQLAVKYGKLSIPDFARILVTMGNGRSFGETAQEMRLLTDTQIKGLLKIQSEYDCPLGKYFLENKLLSSKELAGHLDEMRIHNRAQLRRSEQGKTRVMKAAQTLRNW